MKRAKLSEVNSFTVKAIKWDKEDYTEDINQSFYGELFSETNVI